MLIEKHIKLLRKALGTLQRPRSGLKNQAVRLAKFFYLLLLWGLEIPGDILFFKRRSVPADVELPLKVLIVKTDQLGDVLFSTLLVPAIKARYPSAIIDYLVRPGSAPVLENNPNIASVYLWNNHALEFLPGRGNRENLWQKVGENQQIARILASNEYDFVINARAYPPSSNLWLRKFGRRLIAFDISEKSFLADYWAAYNLNEDESSNYARLLQPLGIDADSVGAPNEFFNCAAPNPMPPDCPYMVISPVSYETDRQWSAECWYQLLTCILERGVSVAICGLASQRESIDAITCKGCNNPDKVRVFTDLKFAEFGALMRGAHAFAGIDSFPAHLAIVLQRRSAVLVNPAAYFLKGLSKETFALEARSMLPTTPWAAFFDVRSARAEDVATFCLTGGEEVGRTPSPGGYASVKTTFSQFR